MMPFGSSACLICLVTQIPASPTISVKVHTWLFCATQKIQTKKINKLKFCITETSENSQKLFLLCKHCSLPFLVLRLKSTLEVRSHSQVRKPTITRLQSRLYWTLNRVNPTVTWRSDPYLKP